MVITIYFFIWHVLRTQKLTVCNWHEHEQLKLLWKLQVVRVYLVCKRDYFLLSTQPLANTFLCVFTHLKDSACKRDYFLLSTQPLAKTFLCIFTHLKDNACKRDYYFLLSTQLLANAILCTFTHLKDNALYLFSKRILIARSASHLLENWMTPMSFPLSSANLISPASRNLSFSCCHVAEGGSYRQ